MRNLNKSILVKKKEKQYRKAISAIRKSVIHDAENFGLVPLIEAKSGKESTRDSRHLDICSRLVAVGEQLDICSRLYEIATYNMRRVHVTIKKYSVHKPTYIQIRLFTAKEIEAMKQVVYNHYTLNEYRELS